MSCAGMLDCLEPMAATLTQEGFTGPDWVFERKFDGIRLLAYKHGCEVQLYSRNRLPQHLPGVTAAVANLPVDDVVLDGEMTWDGHSAYHVFDAPASVHCSWATTTATTLSSQETSAPASTLLLELRTRLDAIEVTAPPFTTPKGLPRLRAHWVRPELIVQVGFIEWTVHGKLRHPRFLGIRTDKSPREVVREDA